MIDSLFDIPETPSPKLLWMRRLKLSETTTPALPGSVIVMGPDDPPLDSQIGIGDTLDDALTDYARKHGLKLWNEA